VELDADGRAVRLSHPDKVYFPQKGCTKKDVTDHFRALGPGILRAPRERPTTLQRFVDCNRTARDRTIASARSVRPFPHAPVSAPLRREETDDAEPRDFGLRTMPVRYAEVGDPHADMDDHAFRPDQLLEPAGRDEHERGLGGLPCPPDHPKMPGEPKRVRPSRARHEGGDA